MEYTIIGDNVNLGQRIESMAGRWQVFVSESTYTPNQGRCIAVGLPPVEVKGKTAPIKIYSIRGVEVAPDELVLNLTVHLLDEKGERKGRGMLTNAAGPWDNPFLNLITDSEIGPGARVRMEFDTPELKRAFRLSGRAEAVDAGVHDGKAIYSKVSLRSLEGDREAIEFLRPGFFVESRKTWDEMKRK